MDAYTWPKMGMALACQTADGSGDEQAVFINHVPEHPHILTAMRHNGRLTLGEEETEGFWFHRMRVDPFALKDPAQRQRKAEEMWTSLGWA